MAILYTEAEVENAQLRALVALYIISQNIQNGFYYFYSPVYKTYKALQYDLYVLFNVVNSENPYVTYGATPTTYEYQFYQLVGSMINKTKQFDVYGQFGGSVNPNYQSSTLSIDVTTEGSQVTSEPISFTNATTVALTNYDTVYAPIYGNLPYVQIFVSDGMGGFDPDNSTAPNYVFATPNDPTSALLSITWGFPIPTSGYVQITGAVQS